MCWVSDCIATSAIDPRSGRAHGAACLAHNSLLNICDFNSMSSVIIASGLDFVDPEVRHRELGFSDVAPS